MQFNVGIRKNWIITIEKSIKLFFNGEGYSKKFTVFISKHFIIPIGTAVTQIVTSTFLNCFNNY